MPPCLPSPCTQLESHPSGAYVRLPQKSAEGFAQVSGGSGAMKLDRGGAPSRRQCPNRSVPCCCAFENLARDVSPSLMCVVADRQVFTSPFERNFHIRHHSWTKAVRVHGNPFPRLSRLRYNA